MVNIYAKVTVHTVLHMYTHTIVCVCLCGSFCVMNSPSLTPPVPSLYPGSIRCPRNVQRRRRLDSSVSNDSTIFSSTSSSEEDKDKEGEGEEEGERQHLLAARR